MEVEQPNNRDAAVSPVIGVILMVAITVVLSAVVFVLVAGSGDAADPAPIASWEADRGSHDITFVKASASTPINVADLDINATAGTCTYRDAAGNAKSSGTIVAGDRIDCTDAATVTVGHIPTNTLLIDLNV